MSLLAAEVVRAATLPPGFSETLVATLHAPSAMQFAPDGRLFVCGQAGAIVVIKDGVQLETPFATLNVHYFTERGLLGIAFDPAFETNQYLYVYYTVPATATAAAHNRISRLTADGDVMLPGSEHVVMELDDLGSSGIHNGGAMHFGADGKLYIATGENANAAHAQSLNSRLGKILRINTDGSDGLIPPDNPFYNDATGDNRAIWARGLRNPFTFAFDRFGRMFINDVGADRWEEINEGRARANYGWPTTEGPFDPATYPDFDHPLYAYPHVDGAGGDCAITGGTFYTPLTMQFPSDYEGNYFFADYCAGAIRSFDPEAVGEPLVFATGLRAPVDLKVADDGSLYYLVRNTHGPDGQVWRVTYSATGPSITAHPASLTVLAGEPATFSVVAAGDPPLTYRWQRNNVDIPGAAGAGASYTIAAATLADNGARFRVRVGNGEGNALSSEATLTVNAAPGDLPTAAITQPGTGTTYNGGSVIAFAGTGSDPQDGALPASAFTWRIDFHHDDHLHPFFPDTTGMMSGMVTIPTIGETSANVWYRIHLTVQDSGGLAHTVQRDIFPNKVRVTLDTIPAGLQVSLDGQPRTTPWSFDAVVGIMRNLSAPSPIVMGSTTYAFASWSDGGYATHDVSIPGADITYKATYRPVSATGPPPAPVLSAYTNGLTVGLAWTPAPGATSYVLEGGSSAGAADLLKTDIGDVTEVHAVVAAGTYRARVRSVGPGGVSAASNEVTLSMGGSGPCAAPPPVPAGYTAHAADFHVQLAWEPSPSATSYALAAGSSSGQANVLTANVGNVLSLEAAGPAGLYFTRVRAVNSCGVSGPSAEVPITLGCSSAPPLSGLTFTKVNGIVTLSWTASPGASRYGMLVGTAPGLTNVLATDLGGATSLPVDVRGLAPATYFVRVVGANACGASALSNEVVVEVP